VGLVVAWAAAAWVVVVAVLLVTTVTRLDISPETAWKAGNYLKYQFWNNYLLTNHFGCYLITYHYYKF